MTKIGRAASAFAKSIHGLGTSDALSRIEDRIKIETNQDMLSELIVMKAQCHAGLGEREKAIQLLRKLDQTSNRTNVPYFLAEMLVQNGEYKDAIAKLTSTIDRSRELNENWFVGTARLLRSYCAAKIGSFDLAKLDLEVVEEDEEIFWLSINPPITKQQIRKMIAMK
jgi:tetratricopeptide (TPR) repeat protein